MKKLIVIILVLIGFSAYSQTPPRTGYLVQTAKWKFVNPIWLDSGAYITKIPKYGGQNRYLVYDSLTGKIGYRYVSATGNYVPYTGATADVDLGVYIMNAASFHAKGTGGTGHVGFKHQSSSATAAGSETVIFANSTGYLYSKNDGNPIEKIIGSNDTSSMLSKYLRSADTLKLSNRINLKQNTLSLTTTGTSGAATLVGATLNIPQYSGTTYTGGNGIIVGGSTIYRDSIKSTGQYGNAWGNGMFSGSTNNRSIKWRTNNVERVKLDSNGTFTLNTLPVLTSNYGLLNLGNGLFNGGTGGFLGNSNGTVIAVNQSSASNAYLMNLQKNGVTLLDINSIGGVGFYSTYVTHSNNSPTQGATFTLNNPAETNGAYSLLRFNGADGSNNYNKAALMFNCDGTGWGNGNLILGVNGGSNGNNVTPTSGNGFMSMNTRTGFIGVGVATGGVSAFSVPIAPTASANYGLVSLGSGAFNGTTSGFFSGAAAGTLIAGNLASGSTSDLMNLQVGGVSKFKVDNIGVVTAPTFTSTSTIILKGYTVATLPAGTVGMTAYVTDALAPTFLATIVGGGAIVTPVFYNGTNWVGH